MAQPDLTSHHVNYLIWRYLQESGHGEAAVMLQRAWYQDPQSLPFAPYIKTHALVSLVQKGLQYHELEQSLDKDGNPTPYLPSSYFFGPAPFELETALKVPQIKSVEAASSAEPVVPPPPLPEQSAAPVSVSNGHVEEPEPVMQGSKTEDRQVEAGEGAMDVDANGVTHETKPIVPESPKPPVTGVDGDVHVTMDGPPPYRPDQDVAPLPPPTPPKPPVTLTVGQSVGVQMTPAKAADLSPDTAILDVAGSGHVSRALWRPKDATAIVAAGDTFCSLWKLSSTSGPSQERLIEGQRESTCVSTVAWEPTGQKLAVATYNDMRGSITMYDVDGNAVDLLPEVPRMITGLHWAETGSHLVVVASDSKVSELALWDDSLRPDEFPSPVVINGSIYDLAWAGPSQAYACGDGSVYQCVVDSSIHVTRTFASHGTTTAWTFIRCANRSDGPVVVTASSATASVWMPTHDMRLPQAHHQGEITAIELRPQPSVDELESKTFAVTFATASTDETVRVWQADLMSKRFDCIHRLSLGPSIPALTMAFSPDGFALAAASKDRLFIWNADRGGPAMASWAIPGSELVKGEHPNGTVNGENGTLDPLPDRCLAWDTDGKKLAFGFHNQMAIVNLQR